MRGLIKAPKRPKSDPKAAMRQVCRNSTSHGKPGLADSWDGDGVDVAVVGQRIKLALTVFREASDVLGLFKQSAGGHDFAVFGAQPPNRAQHVIGIEIDALQRRIFFAAVRVAADYTTADAVVRKCGLGQQFRVVWILPHRVNVAGAVGSGFEMMRPLTNAPAIIPAFDNEIHFLPLVLSDVARPHLTRLAVPTEPPWIAKAVSPDFLVDAIFIEFRFRGEGVIPGNAILEHLRPALGMIRGAGVHVNAQNLAQQDGSVLGVVEGV